MFRKRTAARTCKSYFVSRSKIRNLGAESKGKASRNCWTIHRSSVGPQVAASRIGSAPWPSLSAEIVPHQPQQKRHHGNGPRYCRAAAEISDQQGTPDAAHENGDSKCQQTKAEDAQSASSDRTLFLHSPPPASLCCNLCRRRH